MYEFCIPYLATFFIAGSRAGGLKIGPPLLRVLQIAPRICDIQIDKRTCGLADSTLHFYCSVSSKQRFEFRDIQIHTRNAGLAGLRLPLFTDANPYEVSNRI
jgi:hypothetical protein